MTFLKELMFFTTGTRLDYNRNTQTLAMQTITEPSGCAVNNLNIIETKSHQINSDIFKEEIGVCNDNWKYLFQTYKVPQHNIQWSLDLVMPSAHCCTACTMHMIYHPHHRPTTVLSDGSLQRHLKEANSTNIASFVQKAFALPPPAPPRLDHLGYKFCDVYLLKSMLMSVATKIDKKGRNL